MKDGSTINEEITTLDGFNLIGTPQPPAPLHQNDRIKPSKSQPPLPHTDILHALLREGLVPGQEQEQSQQTGESAANAPEQDSLLLDKLKKGAPLGKK